MKHRTQNSSNQTSLHFNTATRDVPSRRYRAFGAFLKELFLERVGKITLESGLSCPNRDGSIGIGGCTFCRPDTFAGQKQQTPQSIQSVIDVTAGIMEKKYGYKKFIAYFQTYSNTHAPARQLEPMFNAALEHPAIVGLAIATRPDCLPPDVMQLLVKLNTQTHLWVELGLQSAHNATLQRINRGHSVESFIEACSQLNLHKIQICAHIIAGLPGETPAMLLETVRLLNTLPVQGIKLHHLQIIAETPMAELYKNGGVEPLSFESFLQWAGVLLQALSPEIIIHRLFSVALAESILAPRWNLRKQQAQHALESFLEKENIYQGALLQTPAKSVNIEMD